MTTREQILFEKFQALIDMMRADGATPAGESPRPEDLDALRAARHLGQPEQVRQAHVQGRSPPEFAGPPGQVGQADSPGAGGE